MNGISVETEVVQMSQEAEFRRKTSVQVVAGCGNLSRVRERDGV